MPSAVTVTTIYTCPLLTPGTPPTPHAGGTIIEGVTTVLIGGLPAATVGSSLLCEGPPPHPDAIVQGSTSVFIGGQPAAMTGSITGVGGVIGMGDDTVIIGE